MIPHVVAACWAPLVVILLLSVVFCGLFVLWHRSVASGERSWVAAAAAVVAMAATLITAVLAPADVFLVSSMKYRNGTYKPWADDPSARTSMESVVLFTYYGFYAFLLVLSFVVLPLVFFFELFRPDEEEEEGGGDDGGGEELEGTVASSRLWRSVKWTSLCVLSFGLLVVVGVFVPWGDVQPNQVVVDAFASASETRLHAQNLMIFLLNVLSLVGMVLLIAYTGYGITSLPAGMIGGQRSVHTDRREVEGEIHEVERQIAEIQARYEGREQAMPSYEVHHLDRLEQQARLLHRTRRNLEQSARSIINRLILCCRPFQVIFGVVLALLGALVFVSLLLQSADRAAHSLGPRHGYVVRNGTLPDPVDTILVYAQAVFPLDYIIYCCLIMYFVLCTVSGIKRIGIPFLWLDIYKIRSGRTKPEALPLLCGCLILIQLALNVIMFSVAPDYTAYGSQHYAFNVTDAATNSTRTVVRQCELDAKAEQKGRCDMSRIASLLMAFHSNAWIFAAAYYWLGWAFLVVTAVGVVVHLYLALCTGRGRRRGEQEDEEDLLDDGNPFASGSAAPEQEEGVST